MNRYLSRKSFVSTLGAAGLGFGLTAGTLASAPSAMAQDEDQDQDQDAAADEAEPQDGPAGEFADFGEKRVEIYNAFTAALAEELNIDSADEVDGAIRIAVMAVIDDHVGEDGLTAGQAEALKTLVATSDVPFPAMAFGGGHHAMFVARAHGGPGFGMEGMHGGFGHHGERGRIISKRRHGADEDRDRWFISEDDAGRADEGDDSRSDTSREDDESS